MLIFTASLTQHNHLPRLHTHGEGNVYTAWRTQGRGKKYIREKKKKSHCEHSKSELRGGTLQNTGPLLGVCEAI